MPANLTYVDVDIIDLRLSDSSVNTIEKSATSVVRAAGIAELLLPADSTPTAVWLGAVTGQLYCRPGDKVLNASYRDTGNLNIFALTKTTAASPINQFTSPALSTAPPAVFFENAGVLPRVDTFTELSPGTWWFGSVYGIELPGNSGFAVNAQVTQTGTAAMGHVFLVIGTNKRMMASKNGIPFNLAGATLSDGTLTNVTASLTAIPSLYIRLPGGEDPDTLTNVESRLRVLPFGTSIANTLGVAVSSLPKHEETALRDYNHPVNGPGKEQEKRVLSGVKDRRFVAAGAEAGAPWMIAGYGSVGYRPRIACNNARWLWTRVSVPPQVVFMHSDGGDVRSNLVLPLPPAAVIYGDIDILERETTPTPRPAAGKWSWGPFFTKLTLNGSSNMAVGDTVTDVGATQGYVVDTDTSGSNPILHVINKTAAAFASSGNLTAPGRTTRAITAAVPTERLFVQLPIGNSALNGSPAGLSLGLLGYLPNGADPYPF